MNERIEKVIDQAYLELAKEKGEIQFVGQRTIAAKVAELIVLECADVCESFGESGDGYTCSAEILEHFGVEE